jgi:hypothetical protein
MQLSETLILFQPLIIKMDNRKVKKVKVSIKAEQQNKTRTMHHNISNTTACNGNPIICFNCGKSDHKKVKCPKGQEGNGGVTNDVAYGSSVAFDTQEMHPA